MLLSTSVEIRQSKIASWPTIRRSRICVFTQPPPIAEIQTGTLPNTRCSFSSITLPALDNNVAIARVDLHREAHATGAFGGDDRGAAAREGLVNRVILGAVVDHRAPHAFDRFLGAVTRRLVFVVYGADGPHGRLVARALPMAGRALAHGIEAGLMLPVVIAAPEHEARLRPDDLRTDRESRRLQALGDRLGVHTGMPDIGDVAREQGPSLAPVGAVVVRNLAGACGRRDARLVKRLEALGGEIDGGNPVMRRIRAGQK